MSIYQLTRSLNLFSGAKDGSSAQSETEGGEQLQADWAASWGHKLSAHYALLC